MRIILYTGKGGVGKTSIAAATACRIAGSGKKVLIMSTDQAHSLRDSFEKEIGNAPVQIMENLDAMEIDAVEESEKAWGNIQDYIKRLLTLKSEQTLETEELLVFPGLEELFSLSKMLDIYEEGKYDVLVVDCAPTGETFSLLKFPEMMGQFIESILPTKRKIVNKAGPVVEKITSIPMPDDSVFSAMEKLMHRLERLQKLMQDKETLSIRLVTTPERVVIQETKRSFTGFHLHDYNVDALIVNKVYPREALQGYFGRWAVLQEQGMKEIEESFQDIPVFQKELQKHELKSVPLLLEAADLYGDTDPQAVLCCKQIFSMETEGAQSILKIALPFAEKEQMELTQKGGEITIIIENERRTYTLPDVLKGREVHSAKLEEGCLKVAFDTQI